MNRIKSKISRPIVSKLLGFSFYKTLATWSIRKTKTSIDRFKKKLKAISKRNNGKIIKTKLQELKPVITGWINYFRLADTKKNMEYLMEWIRTRPRMGIWKAWKNCKTKVKKLQKLGINRQKSHEWGNTSRGYCRVAHIPIM